MGRPRGPDKTAVTVYLPDVLLAKIKSYLRQHDMSMTDFIEVSTRARLDPEPFVPVALPSVQPRPVVEAKPTAQEIAARYGITTAARLEQEPDSAPIQVGDCPVEDIQPTRDWVKFYREMQEMEPAEALHAFKEATAHVKLPAGFTKMPHTKAVAWLQANA